MAASQKRLLKELQAFQGSTPRADGISVHLPHDDDLTQWHVTLPGPANTPYEGGLFGLLVALPDGYPFQPPAVTFATRIYHPNVTNDSPGQICLDLLKPGSDAGPARDCWSPSVKMEKILVAVQALLAAPNPADPLELRIAEEYQRDRAEFDKNARMYTQRYAQGLPRFDEALAAAAEKAKKK